MLLHNCLRVGGGGPAEIQQVPERRCPRPQHGSPRSPSLRSTYLLPRPLAPRPGPPQRGRTAPRAGTMALTGAFIPSAARAAPAPALARLPKPPLLPIRYGTPPGFKADSSGKAGEMGSVGSEEACPLCSSPPSPPPSPFYFFSAPHKKYLSQQGFLRAPRAAGRRMHGGTEESPGRGQGRLRRVCQHNLAFPPAPSISSDKSLSLCPGQA